MENDFFKSFEDVLGISRNLKDIYTTPSSLDSLIDFERVLDEVDMYAFKNWELGELVHGPVVGKYTVTCIFMWPEHLMPDPRAAKRLIPFDCTVQYKKTGIQVPVKIKSPNDYRGGTKKAQLQEKKVWLVEITMPKALMSDIKTGSVEIEDETIDLGDLESSYEENLDQEQFQAQEDEQNVPQ